MEINKNEFFKIFQNNFDFQIVNTLVGKAIKMDPFDAFIYSSVTGAGYLDNPLYPYTPKGLLKIFYNAYNYNFVTGIYENNSLKNSPLNLSRLKPYLFHEDKYILPIEFYKESELQEVQKDIIINLKENKINYKNFIVQRIEKNKKGNGMEPFMEYLSAEYFKKQGYIVENQIPLAHNIGSPDLGAYKIYDLLNLLRKKDYVNSSGFHIIELALIRLKGGIYNNCSMDKNNQNKTLVAEAKTSTKIMEKQLTKYMNSNCFDEGYEIHPQKEDSTKNIFGLITLNNSYELLIKEPEINCWNKKQKKKKQKYLEWLSNYMKYFLISNLTNNELEDYYFHSTGDYIQSSNDLTKFINNQSYNDILNNFI